MNENQISCSKCSLVVTDFLRLQCTHHICYDCFNKYCKNEKIESTEEFIFKCQICLKTQRINADINYIPNPKPKYQFFRNSPRDQDFPKNKKNIQSQQSSTRKPIPNNQLYCFTCNTKTFTMTSYLNGDHLNHRVKTYDTATIELRQKFLSSVNTLEYKQSDLLQKQVVLEKQLINLCNEYKESLNEIDSYYEKIIQRIKQKRSQLIAEAETLYKDLSNQIKKNIDTIKNSNFQIKRLIELIKEFYLGKQSINSLVKNQSDLKKYIEIKDFKLKQIKFPKLIESLNLEFHISTSLKYYKPLERTHLDKLDDIKQNQRIQSQKMPRKVKLLEKVKNKLNYQSELIFK